MGLHPQCLTAGISLLRSPGVDTNTNPPDLDAEVRRLLDLHRGQWAVIAVVAEVSYSWLSKFARGRTRNPSYATLRRLHVLLKDSPLPQPQPLAFMLDAKRNPPEPPTQAMVNEVAG